MKKKVSPAYQLLEHVWTHSLKATSHSWERLNHSMRGAMQLAIDAGLQFEPGDFGKIRKEFRGGYWFNDDDGESFYTLAVATGNLSAAQAFEAWQQRPPFIADDVDPGYIQTYAHLTATRKSGRLVVGFRFPWRDFKVKVTSFSGDGEYLTACAYTDGTERKIAKRLKITVADIQADSKERKDRIKQHIEFHDRIMEIDKKDDGFAAAFRQRAKITTRADWDQMPPEKIRKVIEIVDTERVRAA